jgi:ADP-ribosylglycohydrolase
MSASATEVYRRCAGALTATVSALGDRDTTCAIVGGIVSLQVGEPGIPADWREARERWE